jgi:hypothetical protein
MIDDKKATSITIFFYNRLLKLCEACSISIMFYCFCNVYNRHRRYNTTAKLEVSQSSLQVSKSWAKKYYSLFIIKTSEIYNILLTGRLAMPVYHSIS